jgi:hypothetical protein
MDEMVEEPNAEAAQPAESSAAKVESRYWSFGFQI